jgi:nitroreductase
MDLAKAILSRRSVRKFKNRRVNREELEELADFGRLAPSGMNKQPIEFLVVDQPELEQEVFDHTNWAGAVDWEPDFEERPRAYIFLLINGEIEPVTGNHDAGLAAGNICLGATGKGLGTCLLGALNKEPLEGILGIPDSRKLDLAVAIGYPDQEIEVEEGRDEIDYWLDEGGTLHVPKRPAEKVVHFNGWED